MQLCLFPVRPRRKWAVLFLLCAMPLFGTSDTFINLGPAPAKHAYFGFLSGSPQPLALHPTNPNVLFTGGVNGGIWKSTNFGSTWTPLTDHQPSLSIGSLVYDLDTSTNSTLLAGIGISSNGAVGFNFRNNYESRGGKRTGLMYTLDNGSTWNTDLAGNATLLGMSVMNVLSKGLIPNSSGRILVGTFEPHGPSVATGYGLYQSLDGGSTFSYLSGASIGSANQPVSTITTKPGYPNTVYVAVTQTTAPYTDTALYRNTDGMGIAWTPIFDKDTVPISGPNPNPLATAVNQWVMEAVAGPNNSIAVKFVDIADSKVKSVFLSQDDGITWVSLPMPEINVVPGPLQGVVNSHIVIDPTNSNLVYLTGTSVQLRSEYPFFALSSYVLEPETAARSFAIGLTNSLSHPDSRFLVFDSEGRLLVGTDGGIDYRTNPSGNGTWNSISGGGLSLWQAYGTAYDAHSNLIFSAGQDTGIAFQTEPGSTTYTDLRISGDGINATINDTTSATQSYWYSSTQYIYGINRITVLPNGQFIDQQFLEFDTPLTTPFLCRLLLNNVDQSKIVIGGSTNVYKTQDTFVSNTLNITTLAVPDGLSVSSMDYGTLNNTEALIVGSEISKLSYTGSAEGPLIGLTTYAGNTPLSLTFDKRYEEIFYAADNFKLWSTTDTGTTFTDLTANLTSLNVIAPTAVSFLHNNGVSALFAGGLSTTGNTSPLAVAESDTLGTTLSNWRIFGQSTLPNTMIYLISYNNQSDTLLISSYGRGNWLMYDVTSNFPQAIELWFGKANNDSTPDLSVLVNGTVANRSLNKYGLGTLTITGPTTYTGLTSVFNGKLALANSSSSIAKDILVYNGATLSGIGTIIGNGEINGTISPGNSIGTLTFSGNYTQGIGSTYISEVNQAGNSDLIDISGSAAINGGTVLVVGLDPSPNLLAPYVILHANDGVTGTYANTTLTGFAPQIPVLPYLTYDSDNVYLNFKTAVAHIAGLTRNQRTIAVQLDGITAFTPNEALLVEGILSLGGNDERAKALDLLSGEQYTNLFLETEITNRQFIRRLYDPTRNIIARQPSCCSCSCFPTLNFWFESGGTRSNVSGDRNSAGYNTHGYSLAGGAQATFQNEFTAGIAAGFAHDHAHYHLDGHGESNTILGGIYGLYRPSCFYLVSDLAFGYSYDEMSRKIIYDSVDYRAHSHPKLHQTTLYAELGLDLDLPCFLLQPFVGIETDWLHCNKVKERGAESANLFVHSKNDSKVFSRLGSHLTTRSESCNWRINVDLAWQYCLTGRDNNIHERFVDFGSKFTILGSDYSRNSLDIGAGIFRNLGCGWSLYGEFSGQFWKGSSFYVVLGGIQTTW